MQVFKFGGASVSSIDRIKQVASILQSHKGNPRVVVISAMGKTTNELEAVAEAFYRGNRDQALSLFNTIKQRHLATFQALIPAGDGEAALLDLFTEVEWLLHDKAVREYDYYYDQIVCIGELLSTTIVHHYLVSAGIANTWVDVRDILRTDSNFRDANVDMEFAGLQAEARLRPLLKEGRIVLLQGFIGSTAENESTTLGREGSDYTAAIFSNLLKAQSLTIWQDVEGVMNADPKLFPEAQLIKELNYKEVIEMAFYGAQVIHPKTIKPLQNGQIPMYVKCFLDPSLPGTLIHSTTLPALPPIIILKKDMVLMKLSSRDFSFIGGSAIVKLYSILESLHIQPNLVQNGAITVKLCLDDKGDRTERLASSVAELFDVELEKGLTLLTMRHPDQALLKTLTGNRVQLLTQETPETVQVLMK